MATNDNPQLKLIVIIPTYNEAENIDAMLQAVHSQRSLLPDYNMQILVVDDNSPDGTAHLVRSRQRSTSGIILISGTKAGLGAAYLRAFRYSLKNLRPDVIIMMDADFSHDPSRIPAMVAAVTDGADYVIGSRYVAGGMIPGGWPVMRIANSRVANWLARFFLKIDPSITDLTGGFKAIRVDMLRKIDLSQVLAKGYVFQVSLLYAFVKKGATVTEVPIQFADRRYGVSKLRTKDILEFIQRVVLMNPESPILIAIRYLFVGAFGTIVNISILTLLSRYAHWSPLLAEIVAVEAAIISNFFMNRAYTFGHLRQAEPADGLSSRGFTKTFMMFQGGAVGVSLISYAIFAALYQGASLNYILADIISIIIGFGLGLYYNSRLVWGTQSA